MACKACKISEEKRYGFFKRENNWVKIRISYLLKFRDLKLSILLVFINLYILKQSYLPILSPLAGPQLVEQAVVLWEICLFQS